MGFGGKDKNLAEQLKESQARTSELEGQLTEAQKQVSDATAKIGDLEGQVAAKQQDLDAAAAKATEAAQALAAAEDRATKAEAKSADLEKKLSSPGDAYSHASEGKKTPVAEGGAEGSESPSTWAEALKAEGGNYVAARRKHPEAFESQFKK